MIPSEINGYVSKDDYILLKWLNPVLAAITYFIFAYGMWQLPNIQEAFIPNLFAMMVFFCIGLFSQL